MPQSDRPNRTQQPSHPALPARPALPSLPPSPPSKKVIWASASDKETPQNVPNPAARLTFVCAAIRRPAPLTTAARCSQWKSYDLFFLPFFFFLLCPRISGYVRASYCPKYSQMLPIVPYTMSKMAAVSLLLVCLCVLCGCYITF